MQSLLPADYMPYRVGGLLYTPAIKIDIADKILSQKIKNLTSVAFCLEDSINDDVLIQAEEQLKKTLTVLGNNDKELPLLFVRIRSIEHLKRIHHFLENSESILTGYILPKFDLSNLSSYCSLIRDYNKTRVNRLYMMPVLESKIISDISDRARVLSEIKKYLDQFRDYVLNIRVGGNDLSNIYGLRRSESQSIYQIGVLRDILVDIINVFGVDYVVSGPVWEYFGSNPSMSWADGLRMELEQDRINGFIGKTAIHPSQLPIIYESLKVSRRDYEDALSIINWTNTNLAVAKSKDGNRMNEVKCHLRWARRIITLAGIYGVN